MKCNIQLPFFVLNREDAIACFREYNREVIFRKVGYHYCSHYSVDEILFSHAISKFQDLVRFDE